MFRELIPKKNVFMQCNAKNVTCGVLQGSSIIPLFFLMNIENIRVDLSESICDPLTKKFASFFTVKKNEIKRM